LTAGGDEPNTGRAVTITLSSTGRRSPVVSIGAPLAGAAAAYLLWWISDRLLVIGPFDRAAWGWLRPAMTRRVNLREPHLTTIEPLGWAEIGLPDGHRPSAAADSALGRPFLRRYVRLVHTRRIPTSWRYRRRRQGSGPARWSRSSPDGKSPTERAAHGSDPRSLADIVTGWESAQPTLRIPKRRGLARPSGFVSIAN
jgi:hypothetical protein